MKKVILSHARSLLDYKHNFIFQLIDEKDSLWEKQEFITLIKNMDKDFFVPYPSDNLKLTELKQLRDFLSYSINQIEKENK